MLSNVKSSKRALNIKKSINTCYAIKRRVPLYFRNYKKKFMAYSAYNSEKYGSRMNIRRL